MRNASSLSGVMALCAATHLAGAQPHAINFESFEYSGTNALETRVGPGEFQNPILTGFYPDPSICRAGDDFYLINSTFAYFPGIPIFQSRDLVNWKQVGHVIHRTNQLRYDRVGVSGGIFAPAITHYKDTFYVVCTQVGGNGNFVVTATNAAGPWSDATELRFDGIDPSLFFDDDGRAWMVNNGGPEGQPLYDGHRAIWIQEFDHAAKKMVGPRKVLVNGGVDISTKPVWIEGPHIYKANGWYYLCCAEGGTGPQHSQVILRSKNVDGPYTPWEKNPILTQRDLSPNTPDAVTCTGHADLVIGPDDNWWAVFLAVRPYQQGRFSPMGRETYLLPVKWTDDGWPTILPPGQRVPLVAKSPKGVSVQQSKALPLNGNFTWRDDFNEASLSPAWIMLRTPKETWWSLEGGKLKLTPRADLLSGRGNPSFLARRVQHSRFTASLTLEAPKESGVSAGLAVFQGERHHYFAGIRAGTNGMSLFLERPRGRTPEIIKTVQLANVGSVRLRVVANDAKCAFEYATEKGSWETLASDLDATILTTDVAGGFVGATVGPHARTEPASAP